MISWRLEITFCIFLPIILGIRALFEASFPKVSWCPKYPKTGETLPSTGFYTWVMLQLTWNVGFKTFYEFLYIQSPWFGVFGPNFPDLCQCPKYTKTGINQPSDSLYIWVRFHLMWNVEFNFLDNFLRIGGPWLGVFGLSLYDLPQCCKYTKQLKLTLRWHLHLSRTSFDVKCGV